MPKPSADDPTGPLYVNYATAPGSPFQGIPSTQPEGERAANADLTAALTNSLIPSAELIENLGLYLDRSALSHILFIHDLYKRILPVHGVILEFGARWGRNLALFAELRNIYEPRNFLRRIVGFDTFEGFPGVSAADGSAPGVTTGAYSVEPGYEQHLTALLRTHEQFGFRPNLLKHEIVKGDLVQTLPDYIDRHPETIVALAYFDLDLFEGTAGALQVIGDRLVRGSVVAFDELCMQQFPGETQALLETWGLRQLKLRRTPLSYGESFVVLE